MTELTEQVCQMYSKPIKENLFRHRKRRQISKRNFRRFQFKTKWVFEEVIEYDSDFELEIVEQDPDIDSIEIFGKLPRLKIKTPLGDYNPIFAMQSKAPKEPKYFL